MYHWSMEGDAQPVKMFERHSSLAGCQVQINTLPTLVMVGAMLRILAQHFDADPDPCLDHT